MAFLAAWALGFFGWTRRDSEPVKQEGYQAPLQISCPYAGLSPLEVGALFKRLADARERKEAAVGSKDYRAGSPEPPPRTCVEAHNSCSACSNRSSVGSSSSGCSSRCVAFGTPSAGTNGRVPAWPLPEAPQEPLSPSEQLASPCLTQEPAVACEAEVPPQAPQPYWYGGSDLRQCTRERRLGCGNYGWVDQASVHLPDGSTLRMAVKTMLPLKDPEVMQQLAQRELDGMRAMQGCPHALQLYGSTLGAAPGAGLAESCGAYQLFMELADGGTLTNELDAAVRASPRTNGHKRWDMLLPAIRVAEVAHAVLSAVDHMHGNAMAHCDIKPDNILLMADGGVRLADPGLACAADGSGLLLSAAGSQKFCSPEMWAKLKDRPCRYPVSLKADVFSVARTLALCCCWHDDPVSWDEYLRWEKDLPGCVPAGLKEIIAAMAAEDPAERPTAREVLDHPWLVEAMQQAEQQRRAGRAL